MFEFVHWALFLVCIGLDCLMPSKHKFGFDQVNCPLIYGSLNVRGWLWRQPTVILLN